MKNINKLLACMGVMVACFAGIPTASCASVAGYVQFVNGDVQITNPAGQIRPAQKGDAISEGDTLTSAPSASAQIKMQDGGFVAVRSDTKLKFDQFVFAGKQDGSEKSFFSLFKGGFRAVTGLIGSVNKQNYKITTPAATIGIRGTDHETFLVVPGTTMAQIAPAGAYNKVNKGVTFMATEKGTIFIQPNQMGYAGGMNQAPQLQPINTKVFTVAEAATPEAKAEKKEEKKEETAEAKQEKVAKSDKEEKKEEKKEEGKQADKGEAKSDAKEAKQANAEQATPAGSGEQVAGTTAAAGGTQDAAGGTTPTAGTTNGGATSGAAQETTTTAAAPAPAPAPAMVIAPQEPAPIRISAVVDAVPPSAGLIQTPVSPVIAAPTVVAPVIAPPPPPATVVPTTTTVGGLAVNLTTGTATTTTGQVVPVTNLGITDTAVNLINNPLVTPGTNVTVIGVATIAQLASIDAANGVGTLTYTAIGDTVVNLSTNIGGYLAGAVNVTVLDTVAVAVATLAPIDVLTTGTVKAANLADTVANLAPGGVASIYIGGGSNVTLTDVVTVAQATAIDTANVAGTLAFAAGITDAAASLVDATGVTPAAGVAALLAQAPNVTVTGAATIAQLTYINNTNGAGVVSYTAISDTAANLFTNTGSYVTGGTNVTVTDAASIAQLSSIDTANTTGTVSYAAVTDTAATLAGSAYVTGGTNVTVTDAASIAQLSAIDTANTTGALAYTTVGDTVANLTANAGSYVVAGTSVAVTDAASLAQLVTIDTINGAGAVSFTNVTNANAEHRILFDVPVTGGVNEGWIYSANPSPTANSSYLFDGNNNLTGITDTPYRTYDQVTLLSGIINADIQFIGGISYDKFAAADNSIYMGRWAGGSMSVTDLAVTAPVAPFTVSAGTSSTHWVLAQIVPKIAPGISKVQNMVGTTTYTMNGATRPTDSFGNVGSVTAATLSANFTTQTVATAAQLTFSATDPVNISAKNMVFDISQPGIPITGSTFVDTWPNVTTSVLCSGADCTAGIWSAWLDGSIAGDAGKTAFVGYNLYNRSTSTPATGTPYNDMVRSIVAFTSATAPSVATNPPTGSYVSGFMIPVAITVGGNTTGRPIHSPPLPHTSIVLAGAGGNLVELLGTTFEEPGGPIGSAIPPIVSIANANITWSGGTAADYFQSTSGNITFGRYQGGSVNVADTTAVVAPFSISLAQAGTMVGPASSVWAYGIAPPSGYVQSLVGTTTYTKIGNTTPFDSQGGMGVLNNATLIADFTSQLVSAGLDLTMNSGPLATNRFIVAASMPINTLASADPSGFKVTATSPVPVVTCSIGPCNPGAGGTFKAEIGGSFAGANASDAVFGYGVWNETPASPADIIYGYVAFNTATPPTVLAGGPFAAYVPSGVTVALSSLSSGGSWWDSFTAAPADIGYTGGLPSSFTNRPGGGSGESGTTTVLGAASPISALATSNAVTGIEFGRWTTSTAIEHSYATQLGTQFGAPDSWMYGPQGYLDGVTQGFSPPSTHPMYATFNYQLDGNTAPYDRDTGLNGTLTSATLTANFTAMTVNAALGLSMPGGETWAANVTNQPVYGNYFSAYAHPWAPADNTLTITRNAAACPTCGGNLMGGFTGQNYAGAILSYGLYDQAASGNVVGKTAFTRTGVAGNPVVANAAPVAPTNYFVADYGGSLQWVDAITATGNLLTAYSSGTPGIYGSSTTVTCTTCTTAATGDVLNSGIYYGTWQAGGWTNTWGGSIGTGQFHWITGPEAGPVYLPEVLTGTVTYALDGGTTPTNWAGTAGTLSTATLTANFTKQVVGISLSALVAGNTWNAFTAPGNEAPLDYGTGVGKTMFAVSSYGGYGGHTGGLLTVTVSNVDGTLPANGWVSGNLTGTGLTGAVLSYTLQGGAPTISPGMTLWDQVNGVAAFVAPPSDIAAPYRMVGVALTDPTAAVPLPGMSGLYNAEGRVTSDATGNLTQFDIWPVGNGSANSLTVAPGTSTLANFGSDPLTGISWGRWQGGVIDVTDRATGVVTPTTLQGSAHWIAGPTMTAPVTLPVSGTFAYTLAGGTVPTDNLGANGTLNSATLSANFTAQTVDVGVNATVGTTTLGASAAGVPIMQGAAFGAGTNMGNTLAVTCAGTCGAAGSHGGVIVGGFTGAGATGAGMMYSLGTGLGAAGATVISGVAAFQRGAQIPQ